MVRTYKRKSRRSKHEPGNLEKAEGGKSIWSSAERYGVNQMKLRFR